MHKLRLNLEALAVDSFDTLPGAEDTRGTVQAFASVGDSTCRQAICYYETFAPSCAASCQTCYTQQATCDGTCAYTCDDASCATCQTACGPTCYATCVWPTEP
jgi:hypothetical protein